MRLKLFLLTLLFAFLWGGYSHAYEDNMPFTASIVVNSKNGQILQSYYPDRIIYPASLTKMMTAYVVFAAIKRGVIGLYDKIDKDKYASYGIYRYFDRNENVTVYDLLLKMIVNSTNEAATILAIEVSESVNNFVETMNDYARKIKMTNTHFANPHGLFDKNHFSTARDMANLSIRLVHDFPNLSQLFGITDYLSNNDFYEKTTVIQRKSVGLKGNKTGYVAASGYNIAAWGEYGMNEKIFAVLIGANSKYERDRLIMRLIGNSVKEYNIINRKDRDGDINKLMDSAANFFGFDKKKEGRVVEIDEEDELGFDIEVNDINNEDKQRINKNSRFYVAR